MTLADILAELRQQTSEARHAHTGKWVADVLRQRIAAGQLAPGAKLSEEVLCEALGVSRNTLREAFSALSMEHIVIRIPNRGVFVHRPAADDIREIYRVRRYLEPAVLSWSDAAEALDLHPLHAAIARAHAARAAGSVPDMADANQDFHAGVVALGGSERLNLLMRQVLAEMRLVFHSMVTDPGFHAPYIDDNARILARLEAGQRTEAAALMIDYLRRAEKQLLAAVAGA